MLFLLQAYTLLPCSLICVLIFYILFYKCETVDKKLFTNLVSPKQVLGE